MSRRRRGMARLSSQRMDGHAIALTALPANMVEAPASTAQAPPGPNAKVRVLVSCCLECHGMMGRHIRHKDCEAKLITKYDPFWVRDYERRAALRAEQRARTAREKLQRKAAKLAAAAAPQPKPVHPYRLIPPPRAVRLVDPSLEWAVAGLRAAAEFWDEMHPERWRPR